ncbi:HAD family hydrolase [Streptomyces sp. NPDC053048]|uniref:HAD family hydrolase n=1 Tax=Streptomyces sp. NPDC053048 TaxID=3365694 RepID=UPI0037D9084B
MTVTPVKDAMRDAMIWFDFGGVLSPPMDELYRSYEAKTGITGERLKAAIAKVTGESATTEHPPLYRGLMSEAEWGGRVADALRAADPDTDLSKARLKHFGQQWFEGITANPQMVRAVQRIREGGLRVGILSNNVAEWEPHWHAIIAPAGDFDVVIDSSRVGHCKPGQEIFALAEQTAGVGAEDCVLVDDLPRNCEAARSRGWRAVHFRDNAQALEELASVTGLPGLL